MQAKLISKSVALAAAALIGVGALSPTWAATKTRSHMRAATQVHQSDAYNQSDARSLSNDQMNLNTNFMQNNRCFTDEGYGRWSSCDGGQ